MRIKRKIKVLIGRLHRKLFHRYDTEYEKYGREWRWQPEIKHHKWEGVFLSWNFEIVRWEKKVHKPWLVAGYGLTLIYNPKKWQFEINHTWYDGPNCFWNFGPIGFYRHGLSNCKKCSDRA